MKTSAKAWAGGLAAWLTNYVIDLVEVTIEKDIPADIEVGILGLVTAGIVWFVANK